MRATSIRATSIRAIEVFEGFILEYRIPAFVRDKGFKRLVYCALHRECVENTKYAVISSTSNV